jgi:hypothetical protein
VQAPAYNLGDQVLVRLDNEVRGAIVLSLWYDHKSREWCYNITEGSNRFLSNRVNEMDILGPYTVKKLMHYANKGS